ncbi:PRC-barrel domain-containing protein, partial [Planomonospora parontospora]
MRIFIARLAGTPVFDPAGDQIGRVRDVVVTVAGSAPPHVHGLVVEMQPRRRVFLPITRVLTVEAGALVFSGRLNMRRFEQRASETLVIGEMLDLSVEVDGERMTVLDLAMEKTRTSEWVITKV